MRDKLVSSINQESEKNIKSLVDYLKSVIKNKTANGQQKFNSLLLLNELLKTKQPVLMNYSAKKLLPRLYLMVQSPNKDQVLV